jgi:uncharacterized membrane protein YpjA
VKGIARFYGGVRAFVMTPWVTGALIAINVVAGVVGTIYWYGGDLLRTPWWAMVFVPDCPLFSALFAVALIGLRMGKRWTWFNAITAAGCIKYGVWTITVWTLFWRAGNPLTAESAIMTLSHVGLLSEGIVLMGFLPELRPGHVLITAAWFFLSDWVDYGLGFHPRMASGVSLEFMMWEMIVMTTLLGAYQAWMVWRRRLAPAPQGRAALP